MNQTEATEQVALALSTGGIFDNVSIITPTEANHPCVVVTEVFDIPLLVTVEILAQP